jgi:hypothetical protein
MYKRAATKQKRFAIDTAGDGGLNTMGARKVGNRMMQHLGFDAPKKGKVGGRGRSVARFDRR